MSERTLLRIFLLANIGILGKGGSSKPKVQVLNGSPYVTLNHGIFFGKTVTGGSHHEDYWEFLGIRYAAAERFEKSVPVSDLDVAAVPTLAMSFGSSCPQISYDGLRVIGKEDCLFGNIYVPAREPIESDGYAVIVFFHPGSFKSGNGGAVNVEYFMRENVICATFNFRIGALGFLSTTDEEIPDNLGLRDQITFLEFIKENIEEFGGNNKRITIAGLEAGATSVMHLLFTHNSKGLFQSAIIHGNSMFPTFSSHWQTGLSISSIIRKQFSHELECPLRPSYLFVECMKIKRLKDLMLAQKSISGNYLNLSSPFLPGYEKCVGKPGTSCLDSFFSKPPALLLSGRQYKRVPLLIGMNSVETIRSNYIRESSISFLHESSKMGKETLTSWLLGVLKQIPGFHHEEFITKSYMEIQQLYFNESSSNRNNENLMAYNSLKHFLYDIFVVYGVWKFAITYAHDKPVYPYVISFQGNRTKSISYDDDGRGDGESAYTFGSGIYDDASFTDGVEFLTPSLPGHHEFEADSDEDIFSRELVNLWTTFAINQKPVDVWQNKETWMPLSAAQLNGDKPLTWYSLKNKVIDLIPWPFSKRMKFWDRLFKQQTSNL